MHSVPMNQQTCLAKKKKKDKQASRWIFINGQLIASPYWIKEDGEWIHRHHHANLISQKVKFSATSSHDIIHPSSHFTMNPYLSNSLHFMQ